MSNPIAVFGAGGHAKVIIGLLRARGIPVAACIDDDCAKWSRRVLGVEVTGPTGGVAAGTLAILGIGNNQTRQRLSTLPMRWATLIHPSAYVDPSVEIGAGTVVFAGAVVQPDTRVGMHAIVNTGACVDHDCVIEDFAHVAPGVHVAGGVIIGEGAFLGVGASVIPGRSIGRWAIVGAGAAVVRDVSAATTVVGVPARPQARRQ